MKADLSEEVIIYYTEVLNDELAHVRPPAAFTPFLTVTHNTSSYRGIHACNASMPMQCNAVVCTAIIARDLHRALSRALSRFGSAARAQVAFWRQLLGAQAVPCPAVNIGSAFNTIVSTALGSEALGKTFSPYGSDLEFIFSAPRCRMRTYSGIMYEACSSSICTCTGSKPLSCCCTSGHSYMHAGFWGCSNKLRLHTVAVPCHNSAATLLAISASMQGSGAVKVLRHACPHMLQAPSS
jgi:hypothetical protein